MTTTGTTFVIRRTAIATTMKARKTTTPQTARRQRMLGPVPIFAFYAGVTKISLSIVASKNLRRARQGLSHNAVRKYRCPSGQGTVKFAATGPGTMCEELQTLKRKAVHVLIPYDAENSAAPATPTFYEDAELAHKKHSSLNDVLKHLLAGHEGKPCPSGDRPIVCSAKTKWPYR